MENTTEYYTPELNEFYVGFEYESEEMSKCGSSTEMVKSIIKNPQDIINAFDFNDWHSSVRVKKLSKECVESLGWTYYKHDYYTLLNYTMWIEQEYIKIQVLGDYDFEETGFNGVIKNKSELSKLMTMLNIKI